ncbi:M20/M25/M40 family metallo-hydrolase [Planococcus salinus]|uniref:M20/M25/M40 family metallo-hydrolase n=1 Tax=Planococcus salinus TaxID=1848460 RepID=A0A3M8P419_9BACL|nr:M20/M25/M40 family metallo-hydrolase [Planococcus salinus]RNF38392.1 M20/M25/M40 family metallo-hydrolase [Planococcus salinus]
MKRLWDTPEKMTDLLCEMVSWESVYLTQGEIDFPKKAKAKLENLVYFQENPHLLELGEVNWDRTFLTALYKHEEARDTVVLLSHFDTVSTEDYGVLQPLACKPRELTSALHDRKETLREEVRRDLESGDYLFGRGTMDMKAGLTLHMALIEKASIEEWPVNLLLLTVPDEEINSNGMREAVPKLVELSEEHNLDYKLFLNGEPVFAQDPNEHDFKVYSGTIGKIMPSALFYGKESHIGEPLSSLPSNFMSSYLAQEMNWNPLFQETVLEETAPLPITVLQRDVKMEYSAQTPYRAVGMYNVFLLERSAADVMELFDQAVRKAMNRMSEDYMEMCRREQIEPVREVKVLLFEELKEYAEKKLGKAKVEAIISEIVTENREMDVREQSHAIADLLLMECHELTPAVILMFAPPYYPPVNSSGSSLVQSCIHHFTEQAKERYGFEVKQGHYFNGISDLSYVNFQDQKDGWVTYEMNTPVYGKTYSIPFENMHKLQAPVLNVGPFGRDAHQRTERLNIKNAFEQLPPLLESMITSQFVNVYSR